MFFALDLPFLGLVFRRRPTLPQPGGCSTIGAGRLSFRVRNGTGRFPLAMTAVTLWSCSVDRTRGCGCGGSRFPYLQNRTVDA